ncbi:MAG: serine/threonine-protein kinase, partial [Planctomycetes bacterium]|nr:serine/threonine-protein kinase [Planctomycetota bacterium]
MVAVRWKIASTIDHEAGMMADSNSSEHVDRVDEVIAEYLRRCDQGEAVDNAQFLAEHADVAEQLRSFFDHCDALDQERGGVCAAPRVECESTIDPTRDLQVDTGGRSAVAEARQEQAVPHRIGRYEVRRELGGGGFGVVYLAHDPHLQRLVAIKVPHARLVSRPEDANAYFREAQTLASLDHPHIVPVYDVGSTEQYPCFVVSKFIEGTNLAERVKQEPLTHRDAAHLVATVADALQHTHNRGLVHRDVKPGNILIDASGTTFVADFGLALRDEDFGQSGTFAGTPAYMSPEQARGEGHRVDGRCDIFSLGVVLYELLTGCRPFAGDSLHAVLDQVINVEARPPRQLKESIPKELERICLKALSKRATDRHPCAADMADELRHYDDVQAPAVDAAQSIKIVPKGLRCFDASDSDFFLELLPGARDRHGLPESIRFWKTHIEETDADKTFSVGLLYGPSGCGKSSLVRAGLLPRLADHVSCVFVEAAPDETEARLLSGLRKICPDLPRDRSLAETVAALRRGRGIPAGRKVLIVLDQFEQWLHAGRNERAT